MAQPQPPLPDAFLPGALRSQTQHSLIIGSTDPTAAMTVIFEAARRRNCRGNDPAATCPSCRKFASGNQPLVRLITPGDKTSIGVEPVRQLLSEMNLAVPSTGATRYVIVQAADSLTIPAQNALLKTLEEPPAQTVIILVTNQIEALLETIRSRCVTIMLDTKTATAKSDTAKSFLRVSTFERFKQAKQLTDAKLDADTFGRDLQALCVTAADTTPPDVLARRLAALEQFRRHLAAGVSTRASLEQLGLEL